MEKFRMLAAIILITGAMAVSGLPQKAYAADPNNKNIVAGLKKQNSPVHIIEIEIDADRGKIIEEGKAISRDRQKLSEARKVADKAKSEQIKQEIDQDIEKREAAIKDLKKDVKNKYDQIDDLLYGKERKVPRRTRVG